MTPIHEHQCSQCGTGWEHSQESHGRFRDHICPSCGFLELMVLKAGAAPFGAADYPQVVANLLKALADSDKTARRAAAFSLGVLHAEPGRAVPGLALAAICDLDSAVKQAALEGLRQFDVETCRESSGSLWPVLAGMV
jgi:HEAT repeat protein